MAMIRISRGQGSSGACHYCGIDTWPAGSPEALRNPEVMRTVDHYMPRCMGVGDTAQGHRNTVVACRACNTIKAGWPAEIFEWFIRQPQMKGSAKQRATEFHRFCLTLSLAGYRSARALSLAARPQRKPSIFTYSVDQAAPSSVPAFMTRDARGRFIRRQQVA